MRFIDYINEEFLKYANGWKSTSDPIPVYKNPTSDEFKQLRREIKSARVLVDVKNKDVYVWDANLAAHQTIINQLSGLSSNLVNLISGITTKNKIDNQYNPVTIDSLPPEVKIYFK